MGDKATAPRSRYLYEDEARARRIMGRLQQRPEFLEQARAIADCWGLTLLGMWSRRQGCSPWARAAFYVWLQDEKGWSTPQIGEFVERDHTTILSGLKSHGKPVAYATLRTARRERRIA